MRIKRNYSSELKGGMQGKAERVEVSVTKTQLQDVKERKLAIRQTSKSDAC